MEKLCEVKEQLIDTVYELIMSKDIAEIDAHELGEVIDVIKDICQANYYATIISSMNAGSEVPAEVRARMYYHNPEVETVEEVIEILDNLASENTKDENTAMKQQLISYINKM